EPQDPAGRTAWRDREFEVAVERRHRHLAAQRRDMVGYAHLQPQGVALELHAWLRDMPDLKDEVAPTRRLTTQAQLRPIPHALRQVEFEFLAFHPDGGGAATVGVEQPHVEARLGCRHGLRASASVRERVGPNVAAAASPTCEAAEEALEEVREASELFWRDV